MIKAPTIRGKINLTIIDGFVVSPNVRIDAVKTINLNFQDSDHEPVLLEAAVR